MCPPFAAAITSLSLLFLLSATPSLASPLFIPYLSDRLPSTSSTNTNNTLSKLIPHHHHQHHAPHLPGNASLIHLQPCPSSPGLVPAFVTSASWPHAKGAPSPALTAYISRHGSEVDPVSYFSYVHDVVGDKDAVVVAPSMEKTVDTAVWYGKGKGKAMAMMTWGPGKEADEHTWAGGYGSATPKGKGAAPPCSSFRVYTHILDILTDRNRFPRLQTIVWTGHSAGAGMVQRWSVVAPEPQGYRMRYIISNAATTAGYFGDDVRPMPYDAASCPGAKRYPFAWTPDTLPPYVAELNGNATTEEAFARWAKRDVTVLVGDLDTHDRWPLGTESCEAHSQGGPNRRERGYGAWAYSVLKAGPGAGDAGAGFTGWDRMKASGVKAVLGVNGSSVVEFNHKMCVVDRVGHDGGAMYRSECGKEALFGRGAGASVGAMYP